MGISIVATVAVRPTGTDEFNFFLSIDSLLSQPAAAAAAAAAPLPPPLPPPPPAAAALSFLLSLFFCCSCFCFKYFDSFPPPRIYYYHNPFLFVHFFVLLLFEFFLVCLDFLDSCYFHGVLTLHAWCFTCVRFHSNSCSAFYFHRAIVIAVRRN